MVYNSIWSDTFYYTDKSPFTYTIRLDGEVIFAGRAYMFPDAEQTRVNINKVCENYLHQTELTTLDFIDPSDVSAVTENPAVIRYFELWDEDEEALVETFCFLDCWDYDYRMSMYPKVSLSDPIDDTVRPWMGKFETKVFARLNDSEGKLIFNINLNDIKEWAAQGDPFKQVNFELNSGATWAEGGTFYYTPATDYLSFGSTVGGVEYQTNVMGFLNNWSDATEYPMACGLHVRRFDDMLYFYSEQSTWTDARLTWAANSTTHEEDVVITEGLEITTGSTYLFITQPHTFVAKTVVTGVDDDDPRVTNQCINYVLYYVNARGGWDSFCIQGSGLKKENITAYTTDRSYDNNTMEFEQMRNVTEIQTVYELNTHYLTDEQSENLAKNLLGSNMVYLHDFTDGVVRPVVIQDKAVTYQTYQTNGKKLAQYKITVAESQIKHRRH